jgi:hypothetical protein
MLESRNWTLQAAGAGSDSRTLIRNHRLLVPQGAHRMPNSPPGFPVRSCRALSEGSMAAIGLAKRNDAYAVSACVIIAAVTGVMLAWFPFNVFLLFSSIPVLIGAIYWTPKGSPLGFAAGTYSVLLHFVGSTMASPGLVLALMQIVLILLFSVLALSIQFHPRHLLSLGSFWIGPAAILPGILPAALIGGVAQGLYRIMLVILPLLALMLFQRSPQPVLYGMLAGAQSVLGSVLLLAAFDPTYWDGRFSGSAFGFTHPNLIGCFVAVMVVVWSNLFAPRLLTFSVLASLLFVTVLTDSRTAIVGLIAGLLLSQRSKTRQIILAVILLAVFFVGASALFAARSDSVGILSGRQQIWDVGLLEWNARSTFEQLLGSATDASGRIDMGDGRIFVAHNTYLSALLRGGAIGLVCIVVGVVILGLRVLRTMHLSSNDHRRLFVALVGMGLATTWTESFVLIGPIWWTLAVSESLLLGDLKSYSLDVPPEEKRDKQVVQFPNSCEPAGLIEASQN